MTTQIRSAIAGPAVSDPVTSGRRLMVSMARFWRGFVRAAFDSYRPELHYMRGPGPACAAKREPAES